MPVRALFLTVILFVTTILLSRCTGAKVFSDVAVNQDFSDYKTFAYLPAKSDMSQSDYDYDYSAVIKAMDQIGEEMRARGYQTDLSNPDLLVLTHTIFSKEETLQREPVGNEFTYFANAREIEKAFDYPFYYTGYPGIPRIYGYDIDEVEHTGGALVVDIIDAKTHQILWRGWVEDQLSPEELKDNLRDYIADIFEEFPG